LDEGLRLGSSNDDVAAGRVQSDTVSFQILRVKERQNGRELKAVVYDPNVTTATPTGYDRSVTYNNNALHRLSVNENEMLTGYTGNRLNQYTAVTGADAYNNDLVATKPGLKQLWSEYQSSFDDPLRSYLSNEFAKRTPAPDSRP